MHELLAPVGNIEMLEAAIDGGADAVYLAGPQYGARAAKANFTMAQLEAAIRRAHLMDVKVYLTVNTLIKESECQSCASYLDRVVASGVDAIIAQDLFVINYLQRHYPDLPLHGSTQLSIYNRQGLQNAMKLGLSRVVVARELSLADLNDLFQADLPEIEVFAHGAMCYAYSGACLLSSHNGGRSGNRGQCAQSCRLNYRMAGQVGHLLSMRDLSTIENIEQLLQYPIATFKIEGRLRSADYVYHTTLAYRRAIDGWSKDKLRPLIDNMRAAFNRSYSSGYLWREGARLNRSQASNLGEKVGRVTGRADKFHLDIALTRDLCVGDAVRFGAGDHAKGSQIFNIYRADEKVSRGLSGQVVRVNYRQPVASGTAVYRTRSAHLTALRAAETAHKRIGVNMRFEVDCNYRVKLELDCAGQRVSQTALAEVAVNRPLDRATVIKQLAKLGDTPYQLGNCHVAIAKPCYLSHKAINALRRATVADLTALRLARPQRDKRLLPALRCTDINPGPRLICKVRTAAQYAALSDCDVALYADRQLNPNWQLADHLWRPFSRYRAVAGDAQMVAGLGQITAGKRNLLDEHSQVYNVAAYDRLQQLGVVDITLSPEVDRAAAEALLKRRPFRIFGYGRLPLMYAATCPKREAGQVCFDCSKQFTISSDNLVDMRVYCHDRILAYYTAQPQHNDWAWRQLKDVNILLSFSDEDAATTRQIVAAVIGGKPLPSSTKGDGR